MRREVPAIYAKHFWRDEIERTLKRVRLAENADDTQFNRRHFDIRMDQGDDHSADLLDWMRRTIEVEKDYLAAKTDIFGTVGHEDGYGLMNVTYAGTAQDMLDLQLSLIESLPLARARYVSHRFGIAAAQPEFDVEGATLQVTPVGKPATLRLQGGSSTSELMVEAMVYDAALPEGAEVRYRWRVDAGLLRIVGGGGKYQAMCRCATTNAGRCSILPSISSWRPGATPGRSGSSSSLTTTACHAGIDDYRP